MKLDPETEAKARALAGLPPADPGESEAEFQRRVIRLAKRCGWAVAFFRAVRIARPDGGVRWETPVGADGAGWPDLVLVRDRIVFAELKTDRGTLRPEQETWLNRLRDAGGCAVVWRQKDWALIEETLK